MRSTYWSTVRGWAAVWVVGCLLATPAVGESVTRAVPDLVFVNRGSPGARIGRSEFLNLYCRTTHQTGTCEATFVYVKRRPTGECVVSSLRDTYAFRDIGRGVWQWSEAEDCGRTRLVTLTRTTSARGDQWALSIREVQSSPPTSECSEIAASRDYELLATGAEYKLPIECTSVVLKEFPD